MPVIDVDKARAWAKEHWPSPVVRRHVDDLLAHCPRAKEIPVIHCERCKHSAPIPEQYRAKFYEGVLMCTRERGEPEYGHAVSTVWADSFCDDAEEREE